MFVNLLYVELKSNLKIKNQETKNQKLEISCLLQSFEINIFINFNSAILQITMITTILAKSCCVPPRVHHIILSCQNS